MTSKPSRRRGGVPTISDVARCAGVSPMTVSRVINGNGSVRAATRSLVNASIGELGYTPNQAARSLAAAAQIRVGLLAANPSAGFLGEFLIGSLDEATRRNVQLVCERWEPGEPETAAAARLIGYRIDGVMLAPPFCDLKPVLDVFAAAALPTVLVATAHRDAERPAVAIDDRAASRVMTRHLLQLSHRRIGFVAGHPEIFASALRLQGFRDAMAEAGLSIEAGFVAAGLFTYLSGLEAADRLLGLAEPPTAIFASNDEMAAGVMAMAHRRGLRVPDDLSVVGFDDTALATTVWPTLTTIRQPIADMARRALARLVETIRDGAAAAPASIDTLDFTFVRRASDAGPRRLDSARSDDSANNRPA